MKNNKSVNIYMIIGLLTLSAAILISAYNIYDAKRAENYSKKLWSEISRSIEEKVETDFSKCRNLEGVNMPCLKIGNCRCIGELEIKGLSLNLPVLEECDAQKLKISPCRYNGTVYDNNMIIAAHNYRSHFGKLFKINRGDSVQFTDADGYVYHYVVSDIEIINGNNPEKLLDGGNDKWDLSLFT